MVDPIFDKKREENAKKRKENAKNGGRIKRNGMRTVNQRKRSIGRRETDRKWKYPFKANLRAKFCCVFALLKTHFFELILIKH